MILASSSSGRAINCSTRRNNSADGATGRNFFNSFSSGRGRYGGTFLAEPLPVHTGDAPGATREEIDDALRLREILEVGAARMAASQTLTAAEREVLWARMTDVVGSVLEHTPLTTSSTANRSYP